ncbi:MAG: SRPBCC family protein [Chloroflexi bacterium]|nr:SRPBCC family protein [Chloroflexota bacterium]MCH8877869.1 SRPBCC family protein [Chloroflexota bacterium]
MFTFEKSIFINRPQQEVFDFVTDPANDAQWQGSTEVAEWTSQGPPGVGSTQRSVFRFWGRKIDSTLEVTIWDPPNQLGRKVVSGPVPFEGTIKLESQENGTQLTLVGEAEIGGFFKIAEGLVRKQLEKQLDTELNALKLLLEAGQA